MYYYNAPSLATRLTGDYRDRTYTGKCGPASLDTRHKISPIDSFSLDRAFNEIPATSLSTPSLSQIMEYYVMFSLDRTSCFYSVICSAFSIPMDRTSFFIFYGINILISLECTSFFYFFLWNVLMPLDCTSLYLLLWSSFFHSDHLLFNSVIYVNS